jgi:hypothetical protein
MDFSTNQQIHLTNKTLFLRILTQSQIDSFEKENDRFIINYNGFENKTKIENHYCWSKEKITLNTSEIQRYRLWTYDSFKMLISQ